MEELEETEQRSGRRIEPTAIAAVVEGIRRLYPDVWRACVALVPRDQAALDAVPSTHLLVRDDEFVWPGKPLLVKRGTVERGPRATASHYGWASVDERPTTGYDLYPLESGAEPAGKPGTRVATGDVVVKGPAKRVVRARRAGELVDARRLDFRDVLPFSTVPLSQTEFEATSYAAVAFEASLAEVAVHHATAIKDRDERVMPFDSESSRRRLFEVLALLGARVSLGEFFDALFFATEAGELVAYPGRWRHTDELTKALQFPSATSSAWYRRDMDQRYPLATAWLHELAREACTTPARRATRRLHADAPTALRQQLYQVLAVPRLFGSLEVETRCAFLCGDRDTIAAAQLGRASQLWALPFVDHLVGALR